MRLVRLVSTAIIADSHIGGPGGPAGPLVAQLRELPQKGCRRLVLMGDLFQAWIGFPRFETADIAAVATVLRDLRRQGVEIDYVEGNRDFFLAGSPYADAFDRVVLETASRLTAAGALYRRFGFVETARDHFAGRADTAMVLDLG